MNIVITGFYGSGNTGDEAILSSIIQNFTDSYSNTNFTVLSLFPDRVKNQHDVEALYRPNFGPKWLQTDFTETISAIRQADVVLIGGGGLLQDAHSHISIVRYLQTALIAEWVGTPTVYYAIGVGPINGRLNKHLVKRICSLANEVVVRDKESKHRLKELSVNADIRVTADPVFGLQPADDDRIQEILRNENISPEYSRIGISVRDFRLNEQKIEHIARFLDDIVDNETEVVFMPFGYEGETTDLDVSYKVRDRMNKKDRATIIEGRYSPEEMLGLVGQTDFFVGMRLHSVIMAAVQEVPVLGISYLPKVKSALYQINYNESEVIDSMEHCTEENLKEKYSRISSKDSESIKSISNKIEELQTSAQTLPNEIAIGNNPKKNKTKLAFDTVMFIASTVLLTLFEGKRVYWGNND
ncbi:polysaccharide pyruvyl transferase CsaB [Haloterrigena sp. SYSU A121-1]|uniref:Polysaccharide pyruvyl transferase CsaB n=1 Tax=Haloterrigena gelatinilytica TaxID=2741724 RepID=A0A8J8GKT5_9EURY|nr:polysaccharide pyruvyl transferase CsaB [Haloterrigena gelatinilytica]NUB91491.1 polysaccharide pyruvyl transferase CsaB [Haloterrigena gelatinilytica]